MRQIAYKTILAAAVIGVAMMAGLSSQASAQGNIGGRVTNPNPKNPRSNSIFIYSMKLGQSKTDQLTVVNSTDKKQTIAIGSVDGVVTNTGAFTCRQEVEPTRDSGGWVNLSEDKVTLKAGERKDINFTVKVPQKADVGEHNSCLTLQSDGDSADSDSSGLRIHMRQAIRMAVTIPGDLKRELAISSFQATTKDGSPKYDMTVKNDGNVSADVNMYVSLSNIFGREVDGAGGEYPVLPGGSLEQSFVSSFRPLFGGIYKAQPSIEFDTRFGVYGTQNSTDKQLKTIAGDSAKVILLPTVAGWLIIIGIVSAVVATIWLLTNKLRHHRNLRSSLKTYTVKPGDSLQSLADDRDIQWRDIARINKISAPYTLSTGDIIQLPIKKSKK